METVALYLVACHAERRRKLSCEGVNAVDRYRPDAEEAEHMVNAVSIKILRHVLETAFPPQASVFDHALPVVGGEAPVLSVHRESVWRSACLRVEVEIMRLMPHVAAVAVHADRYVALEHHASCHGILVSGTHLAVENKLYIVEELYLLPCHGAVG